MIDPPAGTRTLHPAIDQALGAFHADEACRAVAALQIMLRARTGTDDPRAWSSARLTGNGFPVEFAFTTADDRLRYTVEPAGPDDGPRRRFEVAAGLLGMLSGSDLPEEPADALRWLQSRRELTYGAWLGGRHGPTDDEFKIYVEAPEADGPDELPFDLPRPHPSGGIPRRRMIAYSPTARQYEVYYHLDALESYQLPRLLAPCGLESRTEELLDYLVEAYGRSFRAGQLGKSVGVSYTARASGEARSVTLFFFAGAFWGSDARIRQEFGRLSRAMGWDDSRYQRLTAELATCQTWKTFHGIFGVTLGRGGHLSISAGVRPPEAAP